MNRDASNPILTSVGLKLFKKLNNIMACLNTSAIALSSILNNLSKYLELLKKLKCGILNPREK